MDQWIKFSLEEENIIVDKLKSFSRESETAVQVILTIAEYRQIFFSKDQINALQEVLQKKKPSVFWNFAEIDIHYTMASFRKINQWLEQDRLRETHKSNTNERTPVDRLRETHKSNTNERTPVDQEKEFIQHSEVVLRNVKLDLEAEKIYFSTNKIDGCSYPYVIDPKNLSIFKLQEPDDDADRIYRNKYFLTLLNTFDCKCARCGVKDKGIHLDHFMIPRSSGGTFCVQTKTGFKIHNALPLCETCNTSKGDRSYRKFFKDEELISIFGKILTLPKLN